MFKYKKEKAEELGERIGRLARIHLAHLPTSLQIALRFSADNSVS